MIHRGTLLFFTFLLFGLTGFSQMKLTTFGGQFRPIIPTGFVDDSEFTEQVDGVGYSLSPSFGTSAGMVIRHMITERFSLESGIGFTRRNFQLDIDERSSVNQMNFKIVAYQIPLKALVYARLSRAIYMSASFGFVAEMFPSDVAGATSTWRHETVRQSWFSPALESNVGWEYRSPKSGIFYIGASFHRPFQRIYLSKMGPLNSTNPSNAMDVLGSYLTLDFRYFFHEDPERKEDKAKRR